MRSGPRRRGWSTAVALAAVVGLLTAVQLGDVGGPAGEPAPPADEPSIASPPPEPLPLDEPEDPELEPGAAPQQPVEDPWPVSFRSATDAALIFDDGLEGAVAVDLDTGEHTAFRLPGQRPGDQPYRLWRMGGWLVVGWDTVWAVALGSNLPARELGDATIFVPAAEPTQLWLIDYEDGRIGGPSTWTLIDGSGDVLETVVADGEVLPVRGVPGGLAVHRDDGVLLRYDLEEGRVVDYLGNGPAWIIDVTRDRVLWCEDPCETLTVSDATGGTVVTLDEPDVMRFAHDAAWLSPDGARVVAVVWTTADGTGRDREIRTYLIESGLAVAGTRLPLGHVQGDWTLDGRQFFYALRHPPDAGSSAPQLIGRWVVSGDFEHADVAPHLTGLGTFAAFPRDLVSDLFAR